MNKDQVEGRLDQVKGKVKEVAGKVTGNEALRLPANVLRAMAVFRQGPQPVLTCAP